MSAAGQGAGSQAAAFKAAAFKVEAFLEMMTVERGASARTLDAYRRDLDDLLTFLTARSVIADAATDTDLRAWLADLHRRGMAPRTAARRLSAVRQFHRFLIGESLRKDDPTSTLETPRLGRQNISAKPKSLTCCGSQQRFRRRRKAKYRTVSPKPVAARR
jgi:integrase/recombinase XerD